MIVGSSLVAIPHFLSICDKWIEDKCWLGVGVGRHEKNTVLARAVIEG